MLDNGRVLKADYVAPFAGAWIEIVWSVGNSIRKTVAPFAGAWIEMIVLITGKEVVKSLPSRERGLKYSGSP